MKRLILIAVASMTWIVTVSAASAGIDETKLIDLTYALDEQTIFWPSNKPFVWKKAAWGRTANGYWYASGDFCMSEHGGTHVDAPIHFAQGRLSVDELPIQKLIAPAVVIDVRRAVEKNPEYRLGMRDIERWESRHGRIAEGAVVLMLTGWGSRWPDPSRYFGSVTPWDATTLHFPGFSKEAAEFLVNERHVDGIGIDTPSIDAGSSTNFIAHQIVNGADVYALENVANLEKLPEQGALLLALPIKIKGGTGGPVRIIAILP